MRSKMFIEMFYWLLRALSRLMNVDLQKKKLRNTTWGVFKAYAFYWHTLPLDNNPPPSSTKGTEQDGQGCQFFPLRQTWVFKPPSVYFFPTCPPTRWIVLTWCNLILALSIINICHSKNPIDFHFQEISQTKLECTFRVLQGPWNYTVSDREPRQLQCTLLIP